MAQFKISYGVGGGYNDITEEVIEVDTLEEAQQIAYEKSVDVFNSYGIYEDEYPDGEGDEEECQECFESWADYGAEPV